MALVGLNILFLIAAGNLLGDFPYPYTDKLATRELGRELAEYVEDYKIRPTDVAILIESEQVQIPARHYFEGHKVLEHLLLYSGLIAVYYDPLGQPIVDNVSLQSVPAPDVVEASSELTKNNRILVTTTKALSQHSGLQEEYRRWRTFMDIVILVR
jgi:hypothetical protein